MKKRHWRQRWDPNAPLIFCRRMRVGDNPRKPFRLPGDKVTKAIREKVGPHRLRRWFETGVVELADWKAPEPQREKALRIKEQQERELAERLRVNSEKLREELETELAGEPELPVDSEKLREELETELPTED